MHPYLLRPFIVFFGESVPMIEPAAEAVQSVDADHQLSLHRYHGEAHLTTGAFHIKEAQGETLEHFDSVDVVLVPGVAFDSAGHRLGRGGGYYDRLLPHLKHAKKIGLCFDFQVLSFVPTTSHDVNMDLLSCVKTTLDF